MPGLKLLSWGVVLGATMTLACGGSTANFDDPPDTGAPEEDAGVDGTSADADGTVADGTLPGDGGTDTGSPTDAIAPPDTGPIDTGPPKPCTASGGECGPTEFCEAPTCDKGTCKPRPTVVAPFDPACGCDQVTYYSAAYAASLGRSSRPKSGECPFLGRRTCGGFMACPHPEDVCVHTLDSSFACTLPMGNGLCWGLPKDMACSSTTKGFGICGSGGGCTGFCEAIKSGKPHFRGCT